MRALELKVPSPLFLVVLAAIMWLVGRLEPRFDFALTGHWLAGILVIVAGFVIGMNGVRALNSVKTTRNPMRPDEASFLMLGGIYRLTRNPMYLGGLITLTGWSIFVANALVFLALPLYVVYIDLFQIIPEERALTSKFGEAYQAYQSQVRRWI